MRKRLEKHIKEKNGVDRLADPVFLLSERNITMRKAVFFDIDGTLWDKHMNISESTKEALRMLRENGHYAFICSGRSRANIRSPKLLELGFDGVIASCGAHIDFHKETEYEVLWSEEQVTHALEVLKKHQTPAVLEGPGYIYVNTGDFAEDPYVVFLRKELGQYVRDIPEDHSDIIINKMSFISEKIDVEQLVADMGEGFDVIVHDEGIVEMNLAGITKATGIQKVCEMLAIAHENTYAFGDSANDLEMLSYVAHSVAMGNGTDEVKKTAEFVTTGVNEDGIYNGLLHYGLITDSKKSIKSEKK